MKKIKKKISGILLAFILILSNFNNVKAYDTTNIEISDYISFPFIIWPSVQNRIHLVGDLKNEAAVVKYQYVELTKEGYNSLDVKKEEYKKYRNTEEAKLDEEEAKLDKEKEALDLLKEAASVEGATEEQINAYNSALKTYKENVEAYNKLIDQIKANLSVKFSEYAALVPSFDDNNWKISSMSTDEKFYYNIDYPSEEYSVIWVKVSLEGKDYYNYSIVSVNINKYYCEINNGKYYNSKGEEVTKVEYKEDCEKEEVKVCKIDNGKYYNSKGEEVTKVEYKEDCEKEEVKVCKIDDGKYYDNNGKEVTKENYEKACKVPENPKTGNNMSFIYIALISLVALSGYIVVRKTKKFVK